MHKEINSKPGNVGIVVFYYVISKNVKPLILVQTHIKTWLSGFIHMMKEILSVVSSLLWSESEIREKKQTKLDKTYSLSQILEGF